MPSESNLQIVDHPLVQHHLSRLRAKDADAENFRSRVGKVARLLAVAATEDLQLTETQVETPLTITRAFELSQRVALVPILRAGLGLVDPLLELLPSAEVWHLGLFRDEATAKPVEYYQKIPATDPPDVAILVDPMLATGGSATAALDVLSRWGVGETKLVVLIAAPEGIESVHQRFPTTKIVTAAVDENLNDKKFIVPGLGDAGDRLFNTVPK